MKTLITFLTLSLLAMVAVATDATPTVEIYDLATKSAGYSGQVVVVKFGYRDGDMLSGYKGHLAAKMRTEVPDEGRRWFNAIPTQVSKTTPLSAVVRVDSGHLVLVGRTLQNGSPAW